MPPSTLKSNENQNYNAYGITVIYWCLYNTTNTRITPFQDNHSLKLNNSSSSCNTWKEILPLADREITSCRQPMTRIHSNIAMEISRNFAKYTRKPLQIHKIRFSIKCITTPLSTSFTKFTRIRVNNTTCRITCNYNKLPWNRNTK